MDPTSVEALLAFAHRLADLADDITLPAFRTGIDVQRKDDGTPVTAADRGAEEAMRQAIADAFPEHGILGEEHGRVAAERGAPVWVIDPIDGTKNFVSGIPVWATLVAVQVDGVEVAGVVSAPALAARWDGIVDGQTRRARLDGREIRVSDRTLGEGQISFGGLGHFDRPDLAGAIGRLTAATARQRGFGDFWQHCLVAQGSIEVAVEAEVSLWDLAAVKAVVEGAGGRFTDLAGNVTADGGSAVSSNGVVHDEVLRLVAADGARG